MEDDNDTRDAPLTPDEAYRLAHEYAWNWFSYHAQQRLRLFNFSILALGALTAGCFSSFLHKWYPVGVLSAALIILLAVAFLRLDQRNSELTKHAENYLKSGTEELLSPMVGEQIRLATRADDPKQTRFYTFGQIVRGMYYLTIVCALAAMLLAMYLGTHQDANGNV